MNITTWFGLLIWTRHTFWTGTKTRQIIVGLVSSSLHRRVNNMKRITKLMHSAVKKRKPRFFLNHFWLKHPCIHSLFLSRFLPLPWQRVSPKRPSLLSCYPLCVIVLLITNKTAMSNECHRSVSPHLLVSTPLQDNEDLSTGFTESSEPLNREKRYYQRHTDE